MTQVLRLHHKFDWKYFVVMLISLLERRGCETAKKTRFVVLSRIWLLACRFCLSSGQVCFLNFRTFLIQLALSLFQPSNLLARMPVHHHWNSVDRVLAHNWGHIGSLMAAQLIVCPINLRMTAVGQRMHYEPCLNGGQSRALPNTGSSGEHKF